MEEIIKEIKEYEDKEFQGYEIITNLQTIKLLISSGQQCCEQTGYFFCNDDPQEFIGAIINSISETDEELNTKTLIDNQLKTKNGEWEEEAMAIFINIETNKGTLQFVVYNIQNGYYGHDVKIISKQFNHHIGI